MGLATKYQSGESLGSRAYRWDNQGVITELGNLGLSSLGETTMAANWINGNGLIVGSVEKYPAGGPSLGKRAVYWDATGAAIELGNLGTNSSGHASGGATAANSSGVIVGAVNSYGTSGTSYGSRAVRWDSSGNAIALGSINSTPPQTYSSSAAAINSSGVSIGFESKFVSSVFKGLRPVRWDASGSAAEMENLGVTSRGDTQAFPIAINDPGISVGVAEKYVGIYTDSVAVRWDASGAIEELGHLDFDSNGLAASSAVDINSVGTAVGSAKVIFPTSSGFRAVRWDSGGTAATALGNLPISTGNWTSSASAITDDGFIVGRVSGRAVAWDINGHAIDLNSLLSPNDASAWTLTEAHAINDFGLIAGTGNYDPDGAGAQIGYRRLYLLDAAGQLPEPATLGLLAFGVLGLLKRQRPKRSKQI
ncbi:MAG: PEP-CTERM sorting domain-containing protein [Burkholderiales bacterium]|nr:PEP-CTERM sorting domain-containing protein [Phycisphaerae bacterium]